MEDKTLLVTSRNIATKAQEYLSELSESGLTQAMVDDLTSKNQEFENAIVAKKDKVAERDVATANRIRKGNEIYDLMVKYCEFGKDIWYTVDEARYNDYIIYPAHPELPRKIQNLSYDKTSGALSWDANTRALTYEVQFAFDIPSPIYTTIYEGPATAYTYDPGGPDDYLFKVRGKNDYGSGEWSDVLTVTRP
jgi:hypothetical protein